MVLKGILRKKSPHEAEIAQFLSSEPLRSDPRNHCVPILDVLDDPVDNQTYIVMPMLVMCNIPFFQTVGEVVAFFQQALEVRVACELRATRAEWLPVQGLQFMHQHNVAHRYVRGFLYRTQSYSTCIQRRNVHEHHDGPVDVARAAPPRLRHFQS